MSRFDKYILSNDTPRSLCKEIDELNSFIDKLKVCENCKYYTIDWCGNPDKTELKKNCKSFVCDKWEECE